MAARPAQEINKHALVTGASGLVGRALTGLLLSHGWAVTAMGRSAMPGIPFIQADLCDPVSLDVSRAGKPVDVIFHLAAMMPDASPENPARFMDANAIAVLRLLESAAKHGVKQFIYASSVSVIGSPQMVPQGETHPLNPKFDYSVGKLGGELACQLGRSMGLNVAALRLASVYGSGMAANTILPLFVDRALAGEVLRWHGSGLRAQDFVHADDVGQALYQAAETKANGLYCIGGGQATTMRALAEQIAGLVPGVHAEASGQDDPQDNIVWLADIKAARRDLGYQPQISLKEGLARYIGERGNELKKVRQ